MKTKLILTVFICLIQTILFAQVDSNKLFIKIKGNLPAPFSENSKFYIKPKGNEETQPCKCITFVSEDTLEVRAVFDGQIHSIKQIEDDYYIVITKYGDYYITYSGVTKPSFPAGIFIKKGQQISRIVTGFDNKQELSLYITLKADFLETSTWFTRL